VDRVGLSAKQRKRQRWGALQAERSSWITQYREISDFLLPRSGRFFITDRNVGDKRHNNILDDEGTRAVRTLAAGMMAGMTSPARPWFRLATSDPELMEFAPVKLWLADVSVLMRDVFARSNTYRALHMLYEELGAYGTAATVVDDDFDSILWHQPLTAGEYAIACDSKGRVNTLYREFEMSVEQIVEKFVMVDGKMDWSVCEPAVKNLYDRHQLDAWRPVIHAIEPRKDREYGKRDAKNMRFASCYFEAGGTGEKMLSESGYEDFPVLAPRWNVTGGDIYGNGPGMEALGAVQQLQQEQLRKSQAIDYKTLPPLQMPTALATKHADTLPGGVVYHDMSGPSSKITSLFDVNIDLQHLLVDIQDVRARIRRAFYADLFLMIANDSRAQRATATEIAERHEEKLLMLGPTLERMNDELLSPFIDMTFAKIVTAGVLPTPPKEMQGNDLKIEFISTLAQAQRAVGLGAIERILGTVGAVGAAKPDIWDKLDTDQIVDKMSEMLGVDPSIIVADEQVAIIRESRAQQAAQQQQIAAAQQMAATAKDAASAAATAPADLMQQFTGYTMPQGVA
jgi:hypothetical protein